MGTGGVERQPAAPRPHPLQPEARITGLRIFLGRTRCALRIGFGTDCRCWAIIIVVIVFTQGRETQKLWDLFNMILTNAFCILFFLGEYLRAAGQLFRGSPGAARCRALGAGERLGTRAAGGRRRETGGETRGGANRPH